MLEVVFGASVGVLVRVWANAIGKQRKFAKPWGHVGLAMVGACAGYIVVPSEKILLTNINMKRTEREMNEITLESISEFGSVAWPSKIN